MKTRTKLLTIVLIGLAILLTFKGVTWYYSEQLEDSRIALRKELIKNSKLEKIEEGLYTKLVADTLKIKELRRLNDSLGLEVKNPKIITKVVFVPKEIEKAVDSIVVTDSIISIVDNQQKSIIISV